MPFSKYHEHWLCDLEKNYWSLFFLYKMVLVLILKEEKQRGSIVQRLSDSLTVSHCWTSPQLCDVDITVCVLPRRNVSLREVRQTVWGPALCRGVTVPGSDWRGARLLSGTSHPHCTHLPAVPILRAVVVKIRLTLCNYVHCRHNVTMERTIWAA